MQVVTAHCCLEKYLYIKNNVLQLSLILNTELYIYIVASDLKLETTELECKLTIFLINLK